ncbi:MAG: glycosyltransferase family 2 protein [Pedobacter sp.]|nr:MAG: glycosyltransferase family 2 protein [Pedobacter sp.]
MASNNKGFPVYFLTGQKFIHQTLFCINSLVKHNPNRYQFIIVDDGSFDDRLIQRIGHQLPGARIIESSWIEKKLNDKLALDKFPNIYSKRKTYPHLKKLTDIHILEENQFKLVLDSDMIFWRTPHGLLDWFKKPENAICIQDCQQSYGYKMETMEKLTGFKIPELVNVGLIGLESETIIWEEIEEWIGKLEKSQGMSYFLEQALTAMILSRQNVITLDSADYIVNPSESHIRNKQGILHHYVDLSKEFYLKQAWRMTQ